MARAHGLILAVLTTAKQSSLCPRLWMAHSSVLLRSESYQYLGDYMGIKSGCNIRVRSSSRQQQHQQAWLPVSVYLYVYILVCVESEKTRDRKPASQCSTIVPCPARRPVQLDGGVTIVPPGLGYQLVPECNTSSLEVAVPGSIQ